MTAENPIDLEEFLAHLDIPQIISSYSNPGQNGTSSPSPARRRTFSADPGSSQHRGSDKKQFASDDYERYSWRPKAIAMGSLVGKQFVQLLGLACDLRDEIIGSQREGQKIMPRSYLAFDFHRETLYIKARLMGLSPDDLPAALQPIDAELSFDDIAAQGIRIDQVPKSIQLRNGTTEEGHEVTVTISIRRPPKFYTEFEAHDKLLGPKNGRQPARRRATAMDFVISGGTTERHAGPLTPIPEGPCAFPTNWNTYRWIFDMSQAEYHRFMQCTRKIRALAQEDPQADLISSTKVRWQILKLDKMGYRDMYEIPEEDLAALPFSSRTLVEGLISHGILKPGDIPLLMQTLTHVARTPHFKDKILESLFNEERIRKVDALVKSRAKFLQMVEPPDIEHLVMIRTAIVTPTRVLIGPPQQESSNSVTRRYADKLDAVLRVVFTDEEDRLFEYTKQCDKLRSDIGVIARVRRALQHGVQIGGRLFLPVASSASQQKYIQVVRAVLTYRDHAMWFVDHGQVDLLELKRWMGDVKETIVAKHAARMGLPFSTSRIVNLEVTLGPNLPDVEVKGPKGTYCFTDGCGIAGDEVMKEAAQALGIKKGIDLFPSAIQFRLGGAKGVLTHCPEKAGPHEIRLRPSTIKFESDLTQLNAVRLAKYQVAFLNRQFIIIMEANGIPKQLFLDLFRDAVKSIKGLRERVQARRTTKEDSRLISLCSEFPLGVLIKAGFHQDPLVLDICSVIECRALQDLKWRARVELPTGVFLIGVADEYNCLREGEVFCQIQENEDAEPRVVLADVIVCRAPALHPGDVRKARAIDRPELRRLKNVLVFSTQGKRDLPNMLGGGDLDGDDYTLIWDERFVNNLREYEPMDYTAPPPIRVERVTQAHLNENFCQYILNDVLGQVDNAHLALSDQFTPFDEKCLKLSEIHSTAVDFAKTGQAAQVDPWLRPKRWPDFMDRDDSRVNTYASPNILGELFRMVQPDPHFRPSDINNLGYPADPRITKYPLFQTLLDRLKPVKATYEHNLQYDLRRYKVFEPEVPSGIAVRNKKRKRMRDHNLMEPLRDSYVKLVEEARAAAMEAMQGINFNTRLTSGQIVARHCYALTYEREQVLEWEESIMRGDWNAPAPGNDDDGDDARSLRPRAMISFAWVFWQELVQLVALGD